MSKNNSHTGVLSIAGSDPCGGAGIQADLKTIESMGLFASTVVTGVTVQNTSGVRDVMPVSPSLVVGQIACVLEDVDIGAIKIGMLLNRNMVKSISIALGDIDVPLILDPLISSTSGFQFLSDEGVVALKQHLIPRATLVTPNSFEAGILSGKKIGNVHDARVSARTLLASGCRGVLVTGVEYHGEKVADVLVTPEMEKIFLSTRINKDPHGTGCVLSSAIASRLALGVDLAVAVEEARNLVFRGIVYSRECRGGHMVDPLSAIKNEAERFPALAALRKSISVLEEKNIFELIPEVASNFVVALPFALGANEVAGVEGRIIRLKDRIYVHNLWFGVSDHVARFLLRIRRIDPSVNSSMNIKYNEIMKSICQDLGFDIAYAPRDLEPTTQSVGERTTMGWAADFVMKGRVKAPEIIIDEGGVGKEPMIRVLGQTPLAVENIVLEIYDRYRSRTE